MEYTVYVLFSKKQNKIYIGYSSNIEERLKSHNKLATIAYTLKYRPWEIFHTEVFRYSELNSSLN